MYKAAQLYSKVRKAELPLLWQCSAEAEDLQTLRQRGLRGDHPFLSLVSTQKLFDSMCDECLRKVWRGGGNINGKAAFQHLHLFYFKCVLLGKVLLCCEKVHGNLKPCKVRKVKTQSVISELGTVSSPELEHEKYWQGKVVVVVRQEESGDGKSATSRISPDPRSNGRSPCPTGLASKDCLNVSLG